VETTPDSVAGIASALGDAQARLELLSCRDGVIALKGQFSAATMVVPPDGARVLIREYRASPVERLPREPVLTHGDVVIRRGGLDVRHLVQLLLIVPEIAPDLVEAGHRPLGHGEVVEPEPRSDERGQQVGFLAVCPLLASLVVGGAQERIGGGVVAHLEEVVGLVQGQHRTRAAAGILLQPFLGPQLIDPAGILPAEQEVVLAEVDHLPGSIERVAGHDAEIQQFAIGVHHRRIVASHVLQTGDR